jgi:hypothetical protein
MDLERELSALADEVEWPVTPPLRLEATARRSWRLPALVLAVLVVAAAVAFAVPQSRAAILRFLHLGGETIELVDRLPAAQERPLGAGLGAVVSAAEARQVVPRLVLPDIEPPPALHSVGDVVSLLFTYHGRPVLLSEVGSGGGTVLKKIAGTANRVVSVTVDGAYGLWLHGRHVVLFPAAPPRLAGDVLVWEDTDTTYRLEGAGLTKDDAVALAESLLSR